MKPINEKERTNAFIQFMMLLTVLLILAMILTLPNGKVVSKEGNIINEKRKEIEDLQKQFAIISNNIDSVTKILATMNSAPATELDNTQNEIKAELEKWGKVETKDTTGIEKLNVSIAKALKSWASDKRSVNAVNNNKNNLESLQADLKAMTAKYENKKEEYDTYVATHLK